MKIIGLTGRAGSGKTTAAIHLCSHYRFKKMAFAEPVKRAAMQIFGLSEKQVYTQEGKSTIDPRWDATPREILQQFGTEAMRGTFGSDFWVYVLSQEIAKMPKDSRIVIDDVRFDEEAQMIRDLGGEIWFIDRWGHVPFIKKVIHSLTAHASERGINKKYIHYSVDNTRALSSLFQNLNTLMKYRGGYYENRDGIS